MAYTENGEVDDRLLGSDEWENFYMENNDILNKITALFISLMVYESQELKLNTQFISTKLGKEPKYIHQILAIWRKNSCTFYKNYGKMNYDPVVHLWMFHVVKT